MQRGSDFRSEVRLWLETNIPASMRTPMPEAELPWGGQRAQYPNPDTKIWLERMIGQGWIAPTWPLEYGGGALSPAEAAILQMATPANWRIDMPP
jgi:acyl-CoA dehydrogenase